MVQESAGRDKGGFTLIEIIVVLSLISLMLVFSFPQLSGFISVNNKNKAVRWIIVQRNVLKTKTVKEQIPYVFQVDISDNRMLTMPLPGTTPGEDKINPGIEARSFDKKPHHQFNCSGDLEITGVLFPEGEAAISGTADIVFHEKGYCDRAIIQMKDSGNRFSVYFEPFLPRVTVYDGYIKFGQQWE